MKGVYELSDGRKKAQFQAEAMKVACAGSRVALEAFKMQVIDCYAQTEIIHGFKVQRLETTATFDPQRDEVVVHSPTLTSSNVNIMKCLILG
ncbi:hypothetical protein L2E82_16666 [Cichorium intybus]|uniref:Uncharacterized protein n=1 Tax=Cichorium intybus TaxID=13427 RepID=A0ACB9F7H8_CICIN|nr:hypothetical protein L2E82_16666 [Cichorium intybus]